MAGTVTLFVIRDLFAERLADDSPPELSEVTTVLSNETAFSYFGAVGLNLFDFMPADPVDGDQTLTAYADIWRLIFELLTLNDFSPAILEAAGIQDTEQRPDNNVLAILGRMRSLMDQVSDIADDEALFQLAALEDQLRRAADDGERLELLIEVLEGGALFPTLFERITIGMRPAATPSGVDPEGPTPISAFSEWPLRESVYAARTGDFANCLLRRAQESGDARFLAYAHGFHIAFIGKAVGTPFINSIVGSSPRLHWWRARWIERFVDAWIWGFYAPDQTDKEPPFDYDSWRSLCDAELQDRLRIGELDGANPHDVMQRIVEGNDLPMALDAEFRDYWVRCFQEVYGTDRAFGLVNGERLNTALVWTWLTLWFSTSRGSLGCNPPPPTSIADGTAFFDPGTVDPFPPDETEAEETGEESVDPFDVEPEPAPDKRRRACVLILSLLGMAAYFIKYFIGGAAGVVGGLLFVLSGEKDINWKKLRQDLYVLRWFFYNAIFGLDRMLLGAGLSYPQANELSSAKLRVNIPNAPDLGFPVGEILFRSQPRLFNFPARRWPALNSDWLVEPSTEAGDLEQPATLGFGVAEALPSFFVDDNAHNPPINGLVRDHFAFPPPGNLPSSPPLHFFGNAVDNCMNSFLRLDEDLPNLNLSSDRGVGFRTWTFSDDTYSDPVDIEPTQ